MSQIPRFLELHYAMLATYVKDGKLKEARDYLNSLSTSVYDSIMERATRGYCFESIINKLESDVVNKKTNDLFKINTKQSDENFIF